MQPKWFQLLYEQQHRHGITTHGPGSGGRVGLTPSFLVGAMHTPPGAVGKARDEMKEEMTGDGMLENWSDPV